MLDQRRNRHQSEGNVVGSPRFSRRYVFSVIIGTWCLIFTSKISHDILIFKPGELLYRRECILNTLASIQNQFLRLYSSRERQCNLGYDSSAACDSFQLGEGISFLTKHKLLHLTSFSYTEYPDPYTGDIEKLINTLRQCPSYQIDKNHAHCGFRTMLLPALEYVQSMLSGSIGIHRQGWKVNRPESSWDRGEGQPWKFTREIGDPRLRVEGNMVVERYGRALFTASHWDWKPEN